jgi:signal transduction histidine kinase
MNNHHSMSLRWKLMGIMLLTTLVALLVALGAMIGYDLHHDQQEWVGDITAQARILARTIAPAINFNDSRAAQEDLALLRLRPNVQAAVVYTNRGIVYANYKRSATEANFPTLPEADGTRVENGNLVVFRRIVDNGEIIGTVYLRADYELYGRVRDYLGIAGVVVALAMLVAFLVSTWLQKIVTQPILNIGTIAREVVAQGDYSRRAQKSGDDEVGALAQSFNDMMAEIEKRQAESDASAREIAREAEERKVAQQEVMRLNAELEERVHQRTVQLEAANKELEAFAHSVAHDLRAPLRSMDGFSQMLLEDYADKLDEEGQDSLKRIRAASQRMGVLIDDMLSLSKLTRREIRIGRANLSEIAAEIAAELREREPGRQVEINVAPRLVTDTDPHLMRIALWNLIGNAWKFTGKQPSATIEFGMTDHNGVKAYFVGDNGAGFDMAHAGKLFGAFQRMHDASQFEGTGIGLATVQRIVHRLGGKVWAESVVNQGATFYFTLDRREES